jgi:hypothetical protein
LVCPGGRNLLQGLEGFPAWRPVCDPLQAIAPLRQGAGVREAAYEAEAEGALRLERLVHG